MEDIESTLQSFKETLIFLVEQEKIRGEEVQALNEKIEAVNDTVMNQIINPSIQAYQEEQFNDFNDKYGERLGKFDSTIQSAQNNPDYSSSKEAWNELQSLPDEERNNVDMDSFVDGVEQGLSEYVDGIKKSLGLSEEAPVEIKEDEAGNIEVKADKDGDGKMEEVAEESDEEAPASEETSEDENTEPSDEEMEKYLKGE